jgi:hypothetical protein
VSGGARWRTLANQPHPHGTTAWWRAKKPGGLLRICYGPSGSSGRSNPEEDLEGIAATAETLYEKISSSWQ